MRSLATPARAAREDAAPCCREFFVVAQGVLPKPTSPPLSGLLNPVLSGAPPTPHANGDAHVFSCSRRQYRLHSIVRYRPEQSWAAWAAPGSDMPLFFIGLPFDRKPAASGNGHMTAFLAPTRKAVDRSYAAAIANGGRCDGPPGLRTQYHTHYYGAYLRDPDGNKICVCCHGAPEAPTDPCH